MEMAAAYSAIASGGVSYKPYLVERIRNADGVTCSNRARAGAEGSDVARVGLRPPEHDEGSRGARHGGLGRAAQASSRGQDGNDERLHGRLVRGDDAAAHDRRVGRPRHEKNARAEVRGRRRGAPDLRPDRREDEGGGPRDGDRGLRDAPGRRPRGRGRIHRLSGDAVLRPGRPHGVRERNPAHGAVRRPAARGREPAAVSPARDVLARSAARRRATKSP